MKRNSFELNAHAAEIGNLVRQCAWHEKKVVSYTQKGNQAKSNPGRSSFLFLQAKDHKDKALFLEEKINYIKTAFENPGVLARLKRFLFNK